MTIKKSRLLKSAIKPNLAYTGLIALTLLLSSCNNDATNEKKVPHKSNKWLSWDMTFLPSTYGGTRNQAVQESRDVIKNYLDSINTVYKTDFAATTSQDSTSPFHYTLNTGLEWSAYPSDSTKPPPCPKPPAGLTILVVDGKVIQVCTPE